MTFERCDNRLLHGWHRSQVKHAVTTFDQLPKQNIVTGVALNKFQFVSRRAPAEIVERAGAQVVQNDDLVPTPA